MSEDKKLFIVSEDDNYTITANSISWEEKIHYFIGDRELTCDQAYEWIQEAIKEKYEREKLKGIPP